MLTVLEVVMMLTVLEVLLALIVVLLLPSAEWLWGCLVWCGTTVSSWPCRCSPHHSWIQPGTKHSIIKISIDKKINIFVWNPERQEMPWTCLNLIQDLCSGGLWLTVDWGEFIFNLSTSSSLILLLNSWPWPKPAIPSHCVLYKENSDHQDQRMFY